MATKRSLIKLPPNVLTVDLETSPCIGYFWRPGYNISVPSENVITPSRIIVLGWKWSHESKPHTLDWGKNQNDLTICRKFAKLLKYADLVVGQNSDRFDLRWLQYRNAYHSLPPYPQIPTADTLKMTRFKFNMPSHKLDFMAGEFGLGGKKDTGGFSLWDNVMRGDIAALNRMKRYCAHDVRLTERLFRIILPYTGVPRSNMSIISGGTRANCPVCSNKQVLLDGEYVTRSARYQRYRCTGCDHRWRDTRMIKGSNI